MLIVPVTHADLPDLVKLVNSAYRGDSSRAGWTTEADILTGIRTDIATLQQEFELPGVHMLKAVNEAGAIVACVYLQQTDQKLYLGMLTVSPELQNKGVGKQLLQRAEQVAKERNCSHISMTVISVRKELIAWYERHGYQATGERKPFVVGEHIGNPLQPLEFIVLEKWL